MFARPLRLNPRRLSHFNLSKMQPYSIPSSNLTKLKMCASCPSCTRYLPPRQSPCAKTFQRPYHMWGSQVEAGDER